MSSESMEEDLHREIDWSEIDPKRFFFYGSGLFLGVQTIVYPMILVKTRFQVQRNKNIYSNAFSAVYNIGRKEGFFALYKGFPTLALGLIPGRAVYLTTYEFIKLHFGETIKGRVDDSSALKLKNFVAGTVASASSQAIIVPIDIISQKLMIQGEKGLGGGSGGKYKGDLDVFFQILRSEGVSGLYRGFFTSLVMYGPASGVWWALYATYKSHFIDFSEQLKRKYGKRNEQQKQGQLVSQTKERGLVVSSAAFSAGACTAMLTNPLDVIKTRIQTHDFKGDPEKNPRPGVRRIAGDLIRNEGFKGFFKGLTPKMLNSGTTSVLLMAVYEIVKDLSYIDKNGQPNS